MGQMDKKVYGMVQGHGRQTAAAAYKSCKRNDNQAVIGTKDGPLEFDHPEPLGKNHLDSPYSRLDSSSAILSKISDRDGLVNN